REDLLDSECVVRGEGGGGSRQSRCRKHPSQASRHCVLLQAKTRTATAAAGARARRSTARGAELFRTAEAATARRPRAAAGPDGKLSTPARTFRAAAQILDPAWSCRCCTAPTVKGIDAAAGGAAPRPSRLRRRRRPETEVQQRGAKRI